MNIPTGVIGWLAALFWVTVARYTKQPVLCTMGSIVVCIIGVVVIKTSTNTAGTLAGLYIVYSMS